MGKHMSKEDQRRVAVEVMSGATFAEAGKKFGISKQAAHKITNRQKSTLFLSSELEKAKNLKDLRRIFNQYRMR